MNRTVEAKKKVRVQEAFDTLFNKRDYAAAEKFWSPHYIQHSANPFVYRDFTQESVLSARAVDACSGLPRSRTSLNAPRIRRSRLTNIPAEQREPSGNCWP